MRKILILLFLVFISVASVNAEREMTNKYTADEVSQNTWGKDKVAYFIYEYQDLSVIHGGYGTGTVKVIIKNIPVTVRQIKDLSDLLKAQYEGAHDLTIWFYSPSSDPEGAYNLAMTEFFSGEVEYDFKKDAMAGYPDYEVDVEAVCNRVTTLYWQIHPEQDATYFDLLEADVYPSVATEYGISEPEVKDIYLKCSLK